MCTGIMKTAGHIAIAILGLGLLLVLRVAVGSYLDERSDFVRNRPSAISQHPEKTGISGLREISFSATGEPRVAAWYAPSHNRAAIVLVHGTGADRSSLLFETRILAEAGFGVLALDLPGQGASAGKSVWGVPERHAISAAVDWLSARKEVDAQRIGGFGLSMGAYILTQTAVLDQRLRAVTLAAMPSDVVEQNWLASNRWGLLSQLPCYWALRFSGMPLDMLPRDIIGAIAPRPVLLIGGSLDHLVPEFMTQQLYAAAGNPKELWIVPGAHHADYANIEPQQYRAHLIDFFQRTLLAG